MTSNRFLQGQQKSLKMLDSDHPTPLQHTINDVDKKPIHRGRLLLHAVRHLDKGAYGDIHQNRSLKASRQTDDENIDFENKKSSDNEPTENVSLHSAARSKRMKIGIQQEPIGFAGLTGCRPWNVPLSPSSPPALTYHIQWRLLP